MNNLSENPKHHFSVWCQENVFTPHIVEGTSLLQEALDFYLLSIYQKLDLSRLLASPVSTTELTEKLGYVDSAHLTLEALLDRLSSRYQFVQRDVKESKVFFSHIGPTPQPARDIEDIRSEMARLGEDYLAPLEFLQFGFDVWNRALSDDPDYLDAMLSGRESENQELWFRATNTDPLQNVHGIMGAKAIDMLLPRGRILEIGGGTGNGIRNLFQHLDSKNELTRIEHYHFTDISAKFIMGTRHEIRENYPNVSTDWRFADLNKPLSEQKIPQNSFDLIYAVNAAHVAKDIVGFLKSCKATLKPGGRILFAERIRLTPRDMAPRELTLNLSVYHRTAAIRNHDYRPVHCYLSPENWLKVFELAGFKDGDIWPDIDALSESFPNQYAAIVTAVA
ncbi:MAG: class I SAM-dependent methyltransferase [Pseudomonadota bacterium]